MDDTEREAHTRRLIHLKVRRAMQGINTPPEIRMEIEEIEGILGNISSRVYDDTNGTMHSNTLRIEIAKLIDEKRNERDVLMKKLNELYRIKEGVPEIYLFEPDIDKDLRYLEMQVAELKTMIDRLIGSI
jgi:hypothetical protein